MEQSGEEKLKQDVDAVGDRPVALPSVQSDLGSGVPASANLPPSQEVAQAHSSTIEPYPFFSDRIAELRQMCIKPPPNRTITKSDPIPFPPDWPGHQFNKSSSVTSDSSSSQSNKSSSKKQTSILSRTVSFLRGKRSEPSIPSPEAPSTSSQSSSKTNPSLSVLVPSHRRRQMSLSTDTAERESSLTIYPGKRCTTPSGGSTSSDMWAEDASKSNVIKGRDSSAKQQNK